ncbi:hypothetical protein ABW20_dc0110393 [Dactylellina cionopaga]|nr:hypothetical protein ABW20_dc0110393 [Dactylellina cionopaga]
MAIEIIIRPPTIYSGSNTQPCGENNRACYVIGRNYTTGLCGTWLSKENYCCTVTDLSAQGIPAQGIPINNTCGSIAGIHDSMLSNFGTLALRAQSCPANTSAIGFPIGDEDEKCCPQRTADAPYRSEQGFALVYLYEADGDYNSNLTGVSCLDLVMQGRATDDSGSTYGRTRSGIGGTSRSVNANGVSILTVPNCLIGGVLVLMALTAQLPM